MRTLTLLVSLVLSAATWLVAAQQRAPTPARGSEPFRIVEATIPQMQVAMASGQLTARELVTQYLGQQPHIGKASGVDESLLEEIGRLLTWPATQEQIEKAMGLVPDDVVQLVTASGTAEECRAKVQEYVDAGCTCPVLYPLGDDVPAMIEAFATVRV